MSSKMKVIQSIEEMVALTKSDLWSGTIGFVPTMGALHIGHISLAEYARKECDIVVMSIYLNPTQFGPNEDLDNYPKTLKADLDKAEKAGVDYVFTPTSKMMYPDGFKSWVNVEGITDILCGAKRPNHFRGVTTIVSKLMNIVSPDLMYMGEKDYQQIAVLNTMISDLNFRTVIRPCPIIRESDNLAMSSRNAYLNEDERIRARVLYQSLQKARTLYKQGTADPEILRKSMQELIQLHAGKIDYIEFVDRNTLDKKETADDNTRVIIAVFIGSTRLIDNMDLV